MKKREIKELECQISKVNEKRIDCGPIQME